MKSAQIRSYFWSVFSCIWTEYGDLLSKYEVISGLSFPIFRPEITPYLDTFHPVKHLEFAVNIHEK